MKKVFRVEFNGEVAGVELITEDSLTEALALTSCPLLFDRVDVSEIQPKPVESMKTEGTIK